MWRRFFFSPCPSCGELGISLYFSGLSASRPVTCRCCGEKCHVHYRSERFLRIFFLFLAAAAVLGIGWLLPQLPAVSIFAGAVVFALKNHFLPTEEYREEDDP